jgi:hypothetical protein
VSGTLHLTDSIHTRISAGAIAGEESFVSKSAATVLALLCLRLLSLPMSAQLVPHGNVYVGVSYAESYDVTVRYPFKGWNASAEAIPFSRYSFVGLVADASGLYNSSHGITQYNFLIGPRFARMYGKWRPFVHAMAGLQIAPVNDVRYHPLALDFGGGVDYKLRFRNFSWRLQADYLRTHFLSAYQNDARASTGIVYRF